MSISIHLPNCLFAATRCCCLTSLPIEASWRVYLTLNRLPETVQVDLTTEQCFYLMCVFARLTLSSQVKVTNSSLDMKVCQFQSDTSLDRNKLLCSGLTPSLDCICFVFNISCLPNNTLSYYVLICWYCWLSQSSVTKKLNYTTSTSSSSICTFPQILTWWNNTNLATRVAMATSTIITIMEK